MKQSSKPYIESTKDFKKFKDLLIVNFNNININNTHYIESLFNNISSVKIKGKVHFIKECSRFFKVLRNGKGVSKLSSSYWVSMGWSTSDAKEKALGLQRGRSHLTIEYWLNKGYTKNAAINKISEIQQKNSRNRYSKYTCDEIKDRITLELRNDILGIIRVSCETFKRNKSKIIDLVYESIENIKSKKSNRIKLY